MSGEAETKKKVEENKDSRKWKVGLASVAGAALIGVTGGLAAPLVAAGVGSVMGGIGLGATAAAGYLGSVAGSTIIVGGLFGAYGGRMTRSNDGQLRKKKSRTSLFSRYGKTARISSKRERKRRKMSPRSPKMSRKF